MEQRVISDEIGSERTAARLAQRARRATELEVEDFAHLIGAAPELVSAWERGTRTPPPIGVRFLELLLARPELCLTLIQLQGQAAGEHQPAGERLARA